MKKVLVINYYWPPTGGSGVQRWVKFCKYLPALDWQPVVYTPENPERLATDTSLLKEIPSEVEVIRTKIVEPYGIYRKLTGSKKSDGAEINPLNAQKKSLSKRLAVWLRGNLFIPDPRVLWVRPSVKFLCKWIEEHPVDAIVTTGPPQSMHLIGLGVRRALLAKGAKAPRWIVDFRDPWTELFYFKHMGLGKSAEAKHRKLEQSVLDECDAVIAVTPRVQADFQARTSTPVLLVTNGFDEDDFKDIIYHQQVEATEFALVHTGLFASDGNPTQLWKCLKEKCRQDSNFASSLKIRLIGKVDSQILRSLEENGLGANVYAPGYLDHPETVQEQRRASILMLPLRQEPEYSKVYPGKIFEYVAAARPVLGIGQEDGAAAELLREYGVGDMFDWDNAAGIKAFVDKAWEDFLCGQLSCHPTKDISALSRRKLSAKLAEILEQQ